MRDNIILQLVVYYLAALVFIAGVFRVFPEIPEYIAMERDRSVESVSIDLSIRDGDKSTTSASRGGLELFTPDRSVPIVMSMLTAFVVTLPVTWVYRWTRPRKRYSQAFAHTLLVVPIAIALVVFLVKGSLALAFSLAGIVAAVRFRTSLNEPMDAVYMFIVIGTGLAAGVQLLAVAFLASLFFNAIALGVWRTDFGARPAIISGWRVLKSEESGQLLGVSGAVEPELTTGGEKTAYNSQLRVHTTQVEETERAAIPILDANAKRWQINEVIHHEDGSAIVVFDLRLKKSADLAAFIRGIDSSETKHVTKVELTKTRKKKSEES